MIGCRTSIGEFQIERIPPWTGGSRGGKATSSHTPGRRHFPLFCIADEQVSTGSGIDCQEICITIAKGRDGMQKRKTSPSPVKVSRPVKVSPLALRLDSESKSAWAAAAGLRRISVSACVRTMAVPQGLREVAAARDQTIVLSPDEQLAFWRALNAAAQLTPAPKRLGAILRGVK